MDYDTGSTLTPLWASFDAARRFGLSEEEVWRTVDGVVSQAGRECTVGECLDEIMAALAVNIIAKERRALG
jgi:hypothetical protein